MAITAAPPKKKASSKTDVPKVNSEAAIQAFIQRGASAQGASTQGASSEKLSEEPLDVLKGLLIRLYSSEIEKINQLRERRPRRGRKLGISLHDWVVEAINEKLSSEL